MVADETIFRIASITKRFTSTAAMQLVEEGKLDLHRDVNAYLEDFEIPNTYPGRPVTLHHLLTHSAGFEEQSLRAALQLAGSAVDADLCGTARLLQPAGLPVLSVPGGVDYWTEGIS